MDATLVSSCHCLLSFFVLHVGGKYPQGKPGCIGLPLSELESVVTRIPNSKRVDLSHVCQEIWFNPEEDFDSQLAALHVFTRWLVTLPYRRLLVCTHGGVLKQWLKVEVGHGQFVMGELHGNARVVLTEFSSGVQPYLED